MSKTDTLTSELAETFADVISGVDSTIGENRDYGSRIGPPR